MTYIIFTTDTNQLIYRSELRPVSDDDSNLRVEIQNSDGISKHGMTTRQHVRSVMDYSDGGDAHRMNVISIPTCDSLNGQYGSNDRRIVDAINKNDYEIMTISQKQKYI